MLLQSPWRKDPLSRGAAGPNTGQGAVQMFLHREVTVCVT